MLDPESKGPSREVVNNRLLGEPCGTASRFASVVLSAIPSTTARAADMYAYLGSLGPHSVVFFKVKAAVSGRVPTLLVFTRSSRSRRSTSQNCMLAIALRRAVPSPGVHPGWLGLLL